MALQDHAMAVACIVLMVFWGGWVSYKILAAIFKDRFTGVEYLSLASSAWLFPVFFWAFLVVLCAALLGWNAAKALATILILASVWFLFQGRPDVLFSFDSMLLAAFLVASLGWSLAFLQKALLPSYFDSAWHYSIIKQIQGGQVPLTGEYYHLGYHLVSAALASYFIVPVTDVMLVLGQVTLAILPLTFFFPIRFLTRSNSAAFFVVLLAGLGFHMPSHLVDWGKYPALLSLVSIQFVLNILLLVREKEFRRQAAWLAGLGMWLSFFMHTRSIIFFTSFLGAWLIASAWNQFSSLPRYGTPGALLLTLAAELFNANQSAVLQPLLTGYLRSDLWILGLVLSLAVLAFKVYPRSFFLLLCFLALLLLGMLIPVNLPAYGPLTLLDRPYVQGLIYIPLSLIGGLGHAGLIQELCRFFPDWKRLPAFLGLLLWGFVLLNANLHHEFHPSPCCQLANRDDMAAYAWMDKNLPPHARVLIASSGLNVTSFETSDARTGVDGGIWLTPLIARRTVLAWQALDFDQSKTHPQLCRQGVDYLYVGSMPQSFDSARLDLQQKLYQPVFSLPLAKVYRVTGCN